MEISFPELDMHLNIYYNTYYCLLYYCKVFYTVLDTKNVFMLYCLNFSVGSDLHNSISCKVNLTWPPVFTKAMLMLRGKCISAL